MFGWCEFKIHSRDVMHGLEVRIAIYMYGHVFCCVMIVRSRVRRHENMPCRDGELGGAPARAEVCKMKLALVSFNA